jgi:hypothetical protein
MYGHGCFAERLIPPDAIRIPIPLIISRVGKVSRDIRLLVAEHIGLDPADKRIGCTRYERESVVMLNVKGALSTEFIGNRDVANVDRLTLVVVRDGATHSSVLIGRKYSNECLHCAEGRPAVAISTKKEFTVIAIEHKVVDPSAHDA